MTGITVAASRGYDVLIGRGLLAEAGARIAAISAGRTAAVVTDTNVLPLYGAQLCESLEKAGFRVVTHAICAGEESKDLAHYGALLGFLGESGLTRSDAVVALGGGVVGDLAGFAAATYQRGVGFVQVPTTLLAAVDSSVGGKTAIDLPTGKNQAGCFYQPNLVLCDPDTLASLPEREYRCGCGEIIKYGMLYDAALFDSLRRKPVREQLERVIAACVDWKRRVVAADEFDTGERQKLNLGHTFGHAIETCSGLSVPHGCAVAAGMALITRAAAKRGLCAPETLAALLDILKEYNLPTETEYRAAALAAAAMADKKRAGNTVKLIVPEAVGRCRILPVPVQELTDWLRDGGAA